MPWRRPSRRQGTARAVEVRQSLSQVEVRQRAAAVFKTARLRSAASDLNTTMGTSKKARAPRHDKCDIPSLDPSTLPASLAQVGFAGLALLPVLHLLLCLQYETETVLDTVLAGCRHTVATAPRSSGPAPARPSTAAELPISAGAIDESLSAPGGRGRNRGKRPRIHMLYP